MAIESALCHCKETAMRICVYAASSDHAPIEYRQAAHELGVLLARAGCEIVYGGGSRGSMGAIANAALAQGGV